ncbi:hypothetical protein NG796_16685 [Laspinema sp. A4]|uniref:hypothetical protein n=1 Tax=Laspinema sp. D2d TaxID=2953686 RepID=UPI0021BAF3C6|nr:hypothetical protein [Laspinema sp. D2d]MCT7984909.1 hypothetical protein [Laspinema sp. D2d]
MGGGSSGGSYQGAEETQLNHKEFQLVSEALRRGESVLVLAESGVGGSEFVTRVVDEFTGELDVAIATYKGSGKNFFHRLAEQLDVDITEPKLNREGEPVGERSLTMDELKEALLDRMNSDTLLIFPEAKRLTTGVRYWLEDAISNGVRICCFAVVNPRRDIFLDMVEIELEPPSEKHIREVMRSEAQARGLNLSESELADLAPQAGRSPLMAKQVIKRHSLGIHDEKAEHTQYINVTALWFAFLLGFGAMRYIGMSTGQKDVQIFGGLAFMAFMGLKQLGQIKGTRKRLGQ